MKAKKRLEIVWETYEKTTISFKGNFSAMFFCESCQNETLHLTISESASILSFTDAAVFRLTETGEVHYLETEAGALLICGDSLSNKTKNIKN